jgi:hypothetical protein
MVAARSAAMAFNQQPTLHHAANRYPSPDAAAGLTPAFVGGFVVCLAWCYYWPRRPDPPGAAALLVALAVVLFTPTPNALRAGRIWS